jgi:hypothetical protein
MTGLGFPPSGKFVKAWSTVKVCACTDRLATTVSTSSVTAATTLLLRMLAENWFLSMSVLPNVPDVTEPSGDREETRKNNGAISRRDCHENVKKMSDFQDQHFDPRPKTND